MPHRRRVRNGEVETGVELVSLVKSPTTTVAPVRNNDSEFPSCRRPTQKLWQPFWLRTAVLASFFCIYVALLVATILIYVFSVKNNGFYVSDSTSQFAWTYGPTAILVLVVSLWRQVDYHCKQLAPWREMYQKPSIASRTLLRDYLSPLQIVAFFKATKEGHYPVIGSVIGFGLLKLITVFSTGLLVKSTTSFSDTEIPMIATTGFDSSSFNLTTFEQSYVSTTPVYKYYGSLVQGLPLDTGVTHNSVYTSFKLADSTLVNATLSAEVDVLIPEYECAVLDSELGELDTDYMLLSLNLPNGVICQQWSPFSIRFPRLQPPSSPSRDFITDRQPIACNGSNVDDVALGQSISIYILLDIEYESLGNSSNSNASTAADDLSWKAVQLTTVACVPSYRITRAQLSNDTTRTGIPAMKFLEPQVNRTLPVFNGTDMWSIYLGLPEAVSNSAYATAGATSFPDIFTLMALSQGSSETSVLLDGQTLKRAAQAVFQGIMSQWIQLNLLSQSNEPITGTATYTTKRLHVTYTSLWTMVSGFALLSLLTIPVWLTTKRRVVTRDPNTIGAVAAILARSSDVDEVLYRVDARTEDALNKNLSFVSFGTDVVSLDHTLAFEISVAPGCSKPTPRWKVQVRNRWSAFKRAMAYLFVPIKRLFSRYSKKKTRGGQEVSDELPAWRPLTLRLPVVILTFALPVAIIVVLEVLQRLSDHNNGITDVAKSSDEYIRYIPALIMLLTATLFNALDFNISTFAPYSRLYIGIASAKSTICLNLLGKIPPDALVRAAWAGHLGATTSIAASLVGSLLTIVVSGLYVVQGVDLPGISRSVHRLDTFNTMWNNSVAGDNFAAATLSLINNMNLSYPEFTFSEIAMPKFALGDWIGSKNSASTISGSVSASLPALRGNLRCTTVERSNITIQTTDLGTFAQFTYPAVYVNVSISLPDDCHPDGAEGLSTRMSSYVNQFQIPESGGVYAGAQIDLNYGAGAADLVYPEGSYIHPDSDSVADNPPGCPSLAFTFGWFAMGSTDTTKVTSMVCFQEMQQVEANVTLLPNSTQVDMRLPPTFNESSVKLLQNGNSSSTSFQYRIMNNLQNAFGFPETYTLDAFFQAITSNSSEKVTPELLVGLDGEQRLFSAINHFYRKYMAQVINANMRRECNTTDSGSESVAVCSADEAGSLDILLTANVFTPRLFQSAGPKLALQIMLGVMIVLAMFAFWFTKMRNLLPYNPCSLAGTMGLLAGSQLVSSRYHSLYQQPLPTRSTGGNREPSTFEPLLGTSDQESLIPAGSEWMSDRELQELFSRWTYSLQWWRPKHWIRQAGEASDAGGQSKRYGIDIRQASS